MRRRSVRRETSAGRRVSTLWPRYWPSHLQGRYVELPPTASVTKKAFGLAFFALVWNGITWTIIVMIWRAEGFPGPWIPLAFLSLFALIGLGLLAGFVHQLFGALRARSARIAVERPEVLLGDRVGVLIGQELKGHIPVSRWAMTFLCREWVRYQQGTDTKTETHTIRNETTVLAEPGGKHQSAPLTAEADIDVPAHAMHSFEAGNNKIEWLVKITLEVANWPDITTEFKLKILPRLALEDVPA